MDLINFPSTEQIVIPPHKYLGCGIGPGSDVGIVFGSQNELIGVGSPLLIAAKNDRVQLFRSTAYPGLVQLACAKDKDDLALLARPRPPRYKLFSGTTGAGVATVLIVPFNGRERFYGVISYTGAGTPTLSLATIARHYYDATNHDDDTLNTRTEATIPETLAAGFEETERCDELAVSITTDVACTYRLHTWAHDAGT